MKIKKGAIIAVILSAISCSMSVNAFEYDDVVSKHSLISNSYYTVNRVASNKSSTSSTKMSVYLAAGASGKSNEISFRFSSIPSNAKISKIVLNGGKVSSSGMGAAIPEKVYLISPDGYEYVNTWGVGNKIEITNFIHGKTNGVWKMYFTATNISSTDYSLVSYSNSKMTVYYNT